MDHAALKAATSLDKKEPNIEDQINAALQLIAGLEILADARAADWRAGVGDALTALTRSILAAERAIDLSVQAGNACGVLLVSFLLSFASRAGSRERLQLFTTNYDRLIEYGCDLVGIRPLDRFVGSLLPVFRASRLDVDMHYNPPGIRGEPRYLEGVIRFTKLHGSLDWQYQNRLLRRVALPFGAEDGHPAIASDPFGALMVYPNAAKDFETAQYPYAELFRDFSAALCRPNSTLVTYGYGFGDDHVNRVLLDMLTIPSTHLVIISFDDCGGRLGSFLARVGRQPQISLLIGPHFADFEQLVRYYLPKPAIDQMTVKMADLLRRRAHTGEPVPE